MDAGDWAETLKFEPWEKSEKIYEMMSVLGYDAVTPGPREMTYGADKLSGLYSKFPQIKVVSANVTDKSGKLLWDKYAIVEKAGVKFAVTGVTGSGPYKFNVTRGKQKSDDFDFKESKEVLRDLIPELRSQADIVVVLLHETPADARRIVDEIPGMDVVIVGHSPGYMFNPDRIGETLLVRGGNRGQYLSITELILANDNALIDYSGEGKPLGKPVKKKESIDKDITDFENERKDREAKEKRKKALEDASIQGTETLLGAQTCQKCHDSEYAGWVDSPHGLAVRTGVHEADEFAAEDVDLSSVQCEHCHGLGTFHGTAGMAAVVAEETCRSCHMVEGAPDFDYAKAMAEGFH